MTVHLTTLGGLHGVHNEVEQDWLRSHGFRAALLTYLALERVTTRDTVLAMLWPETDGTLAGKRLNQLVFEVRRILGTECIETKGRSVLAGDWLTADALDFERAVGAGRYEEAIALYHGPFLSGVHLVNTNQFESWVDARRARHARLFRKSCRTLLDESSGSGDVARMLVVADAWVSGDPIDDEAQRQLIRLLALSGNRSEALKQYENYVRLLEYEELEPLAETRELVAELERQTMAQKLTGAPVSTDVSTRPVPLHKTDVTPRPAPANRNRSSRLGADIDPRLENDLLPHFEILRTLGSGATARVYLARDTSLQRLIAIKVLLPEFADDPVARARFEREARAAARLSHPNIVTVHQVAALSNGTPYLVMEYVPGRNLADTLAAEGALSETEACVVLSQLASALDAAHARGLIHRDVRPANVVWTRETGRAVLMDFGIVAVVESGTQAAARLTATGDVIGDPAFNSPEQLRAQPVTVASDIYSLGVLGYEILTRRGPYNYTSRTELIEAHLTQPPEPLALAGPRTSSALNHLLRRCLSKIPEHRPGAREVARALERIVDAEDSTPIVMPEPRVNQPDAVRSMVREFFDDAKRRGMHKITPAYLAVGALLWGGVPIVLPEFGATLMFQALTLLTLSGFPVALVICWMFDFTSTGVYRAAASDGRVPSAAYRILEFLALGLSIALAAIIGWQMLSN